MIRTLVVEDDPLLADAHSQYVERVPGFRTAGVAHGGGEALRFLGRTEVDLVLLDFYLPDMTGLDVCRALRSRGIGVDVIAVTSARDLEIVRAAVAQGVVQYLLKPFTLAAFRDKLERYAEYRRALTGPGTGAGTASPAPLAQQDVDRALSALRGSAGPNLPKGMSKSTLDAIEELLRSAPEGLSAGEVAERLGIVRVTGRRYLEYLAEHDLTVRSPRYGGPGRPEHVYRWVAPPC
ncbi:MAG TPA: response regulator [Pseudonocardia sp.]|jgi:response regulator of citrate/malate metabolism